MIESTIKEEEELREKRLDETIIVINWLLWNEYHLFI